MNYIAKKGYVHRDLAARNVLMYLPETYIQYQDLEILEHLVVPIGNVQTTLAAESMLVSVCSRSILWAIPYGPYAIGHIVPNIKVKF